MRSKEALQIRILELCDENELSLNALGGRCGITQSTLNNIINGRNNSITIQTVLKICRGLDMELQDFSMTTFSGTLSRRSTDRRGFKVQQQEQTRIGLPLLRCAFYALQYERRCSRLVVS